MSSSTALAATSMAMSAYAINEVSKDGELQIDFFCKTTKDKTELEIQYCEEFYSDQTFDMWANGVIVFILIAALLTMIIGMRN